MQQEKTYASGQFVKDLIHAIHMMVTHPLLRTLQLVTFQEVFK